MARNLSSTVSGTIARWFLVLIVLGAAAGAAHQYVGHAAGQTTAQRRLQKMLAERHYWQHRLAVEEHQEWLLQRMLTTTHGHLSNEQGKLKSEQSRDAAQQYQLEAAINNFQGQIDTIRDQLGDTRAQYARVHAQASKLLERLRRLKARIRKESGHVRLAIVEMYQLSQISPLQTVLEAKSLTQFLNQQDIVNQIGSRDAGILKWAQREHAAVELLAAGYIAKMRDLRALAAQEKSQLRLVLVETQHENLLLIEARRESSKRQESIKQTEAGIRAFAREELTQLHSVATTAQSSRKAIQQDEQSAEQVAWIIAQQTGVFPNIGGSGALQWPVVGPITQGFGPSPYAFEPAVTYHGVYYPHFHTGIDIAAPFDTPIHAAAAGKVIFASLFIPGDIHASYGLCVIIMHSATLSTLYAHMDIGLGLPVHVGQIVTAGQTIGYIGMTGNTTGPHLHFEVRVNGVWVNPLLYLPKEPTVIAD